MYKQTQYLSNESLPRYGNQTGGDQAYGSIGEQARQRSVTATSSNLDSYTEQRLLEIKRKHGAKDRLTTEEHDSKPLRQITLKSSNLNAFKNVERDQKSKSSSVFRSVLLTQQNQNTSPFEYTKVAERLERRSSERSDFRESIVSRVDQFKDIPKFGGKSAKWEPINVSKSIEIPVGNGKEEKGSIDKIKAKFNHILSCFNENNVQKHLEKYRPEYLQYKQKAPKVETVEQTKPEIMKSKVFVETSQDAFNKYYVPGRASRHADSVQNRSRRYSAHYSPLENAKARCSYLPAQNSTQQESTIKIRNVDEQIKRIEQRIKKSHEEKKKLDISEVNKETLDLPRRFSCYSKSPINKSVMVNRRQKLYGNVPPIRLRTEEFMDYENTKQSDRVKQSDRNKQSERLYTEEFVPKYEEQYGHRAGLGSNEIETGREQGEPQTKRLVEALKTQVELDEKLRNIKAILSHSNIKNKWESIKQILDRQKIFLSQSQIQQEFDITLQQHNPFFSVRQSTQSLDQIVSKYIDCYTHWTSNILNNFSKDTLQRQGFTKQSLDLQKKGHLNIEDLVRFLNFKTKNFYRNRDLILLFRRFGEKGSILFKDLMGIVCRV